MSEEKQEEFKRWMAVANHTRTGTEYDWDDMEEAFLAGMETAEQRAAETGRAEPEPAKVIIVTEIPAGNSMPRERRYVADSFDADSSGLDIKRDGRVIATYPGEHSWLSVREDGASTGDPYFTQGKKLAIALDALRAVADEPHPGYGPERAAKALDDIEDVDL